MADRLLQLPEARVPGRRLGRNINHDPQSLRYKVRPRTAVKPASVVHERHGAIMNQGDLGRCVPTSGTGLLQCEPFWSTLPRALQQLLSKPDGAEAYAIAAYRDVTALDPFDGAWEPDDTGSDGLSLAKLWKQRGLNNGYEHATTVDEAHACLQGSDGVPGRPFITGTMWLSGMDQPRPDGTVSVSGTNRGGHEYLCREYDLARDLWWFDNSWTTSFGLMGRFAYDTPGLQKLMAMQGDITCMVPLSAPAPAPAPVAGDPLVDFPRQSVDAWVNSLRPWWTKREKTAATALFDWELRHGLR